MRQQKKKSMTYTLYKLFSYMWSENCIIEPKQLKKVVSTKMKFFSGYAQHDSSEFLIKLSINKSNESEL